MAYEAMSFEVRDNIAWVTFNRPDALNAINAQATHEFYDIVNRISGDRSVIVPFAPVVMSPSFNQKAMVSKHWFAR